MVETSAVELKGEAGDGDRDDVDEADVDLMEHERRIEILQAMLEDASSAAERAQRGVGAIQGPSSFVARSLRKVQPRHRARLRSCIEKVVREERGASIERGAPPNWIPTVSEVAQIWNTYFRERDIEDGKDRGPWYRYRTICRRVEDQDFESLPLRGRWFLELFEDRMAQLSWSSFGEEALRYRIHLDRGRIRMRTGLLEDDSERKERHVQPRFT